MTIFKKYLWPAALLTAMILLFAGCDSDDGNSHVAELTATTVNWDTPKNRILVTGDAMTYEATIVWQEGDETWCSFSSFTAASEPLLTKKGMVSIPMAIYLLPNEAETARSATVELVLADGTTKELSFTQRAFSETAWYDRQWGEQPAYLENDTYIYKTYFTTLTVGGYVRNYSICFDTEKRVSHWVAYPLTKNYVTPSFDRTDAWSYDPNDQLPVIPQSAQANVIQTYGTGDARGHQCPSADRYNTLATNKMTFYSTNIMPQNSRFNSGVWSTLEGKVRENMQRHPSDTVFVVTGTYFADNRTITDKSGRKIGYPSNCWKVLLRGSGGKAIWECSASELYAIGFWFANSTSNATTLRSHATSVADIEEKTGFTFFRNIPPEAADAVKAQNRPSDWSL